MLDSLQEIIYALYQNKLRTLLTAFGVFWGIFMLILMLGAGKGMQNGIKDSFGGDVLDFIVITSGETSLAEKGMGVGRKIELTEADIMAISKLIPGVKNISPENSTKGVEILYEAKKVNFAVHGVPDEFFKIKDGAKLTIGRSVNIYDQQDTRKMCAIGSVVASRLFGENVDPIGKEIRINGIVMKVVGMFHDKNDHNRDSERVYIPDSTYRKMYGIGNTVGAIWLRPDVNINGFELEKKVVGLLKQRHIVAEEDKRAVKAFNMAEPAQMVNGMFAAINTIIWFVGLGTLSAGIVGISNIMIITVKERTKEIGIRKALGATPLSIVRTLITESILITTIAGYLGMVLGISILELVNFALKASGAQMDFFKEPGVDIQIACLAIALLVAVGVIAGLAPSLRAARIMPIEAMRAE